MSSPILSYNGSSAQPTASVKKKLEDIQTNLVETSKAVSLHKQKYNAVFEMQKRLSDSYLRNMQIILDISQLLVAYSGVFDRIMEVIAVINKQFDKDVSPEMIKSIKDLTVDKVQSMGSEVQKQVASLLNEMKKHNYQNDPLKARLGDLASQHQLIIQQAQQTEKLFSPPPAKGGRRKKVRQTTIKHTT